METNNVYNLVNQLTQESKSLWRIANTYIKEASTDEERAFWEQMAKEKETVVATLKTLIKTNL